MIKKLILLPLIFSAISVNLANAGKDCILSDQTKIGAGYDARFMKQAIDWNRDYIFGESLEAAPDKTAQVVFEAINYNSNMFIKHFLSDEVNECNAYTLLLDWNDPTKIASKNTETVRYNLDKEIKILTKYSVEDIEKIFSDKRAKYAVKQKEQGFKISTINQTVIEGKGLIMEILFEVTKPVYAKCFFYEADKLVGMQGANLSLPADKIMATVQNVQEVTKTTCIKV